MLRMSLFSKIQYIYSSMWQISTLSNFQEYVLALNEAVHPAAGMFPFLIIFFITMLCFNLFIAVISYSFNQIQGGNKDENEDDDLDSDSDSDSNEEIQEAEIAAASEADIQNEVVEAENSNCSSVPQSAGIDEPDSRSEGGAGQGSGGVINSNFSSTQRLKLRMQGVSAFLSDGDAAPEEDVPLTNKEKKRFKKAEKEQLDMRRCARLLGYMFLFDVCGMRQGTCGGECVNRTESIANCNYGCSTEGERRGGGWESIT